MKHFFKTGIPYIWLTACSLTITLLMMGGLVALIMINGLSVFWPYPITQFTLKDGSIVLGEVVKREPVPYQEDAFRTKLKIGNRDVYGLDFTWIEDADIISLEYPRNALAFERREWGNMYGFLKGLIRDDDDDDDDEEEEEDDDDMVSLTQQDLLPLLKENHALVREIRHIEKKIIGNINHRMEKNRIALKRLKSQEPSERIRKKIEALKASTLNLEKAYREQEGILTELYSQAMEEKIVVQLAEGEERTVPVFQIIRAYAPNEMGTLSKFGFYLIKFWEFLSGEPREANTEGGIFPAIFGTVMLVFIMSIAVVPLGVLTAVYLKEYAGDTVFARIVRISVSNLAGVPSIVFGIFGLGFFVYLIGGSIDELFFSDTLPSPTFGTGGILWASLTLALLTVPVVVVATEEGLSAVPKSLREGSFALGATKFETIRKILLPHATPGILTGIILAIARAAGEVAPLMITGVVKLAPSLPIDSKFPFIHLERKFMHLGFHIYDVGFQSPNVEAAIPMVYTTTFVLLAIILLLNITAILIRNKLRKWYRAASL
ncbi:MAG: phosphate ABC transporter permease PstA [Candidatus Loosdrechtia sp.]|uniref:phosphate ABC transporter permease PstA n=1 Tax=Candidatus Loosdrechtia sp. TaxID=3101272 RepID=UPI003A791718|nr:MAG: phosphate ABC transporter permease PstA [Candidatus Jettenia sp. AMX2]